MRSPRLLEDFPGRQQAGRLGPDVPRFLSRTAAAADKPGAKDTILVVVQLTGGNDGLNTVIPFNDPEYAKLRPTLKHPAAQVKKLNDDSPCIRRWPAWPSCSKTMPGVVQGVGYPNPSQSHFRSMDIWQAAARPRS